MQTDWNYSNSKLRAELVDGSFKWWAGDGWSAAESDAFHFPNEDAIFDQIKHIARREPRLCRGIETLQTINAKGQRLYSCGFSVRFRLACRARRKLWRGAMKKIKAILSAEELKVLNLNKTRRVHKTVQTKRRKRNR